MKKCQSLASPEYLRMYPGWRGLRDALQESRRGTKHRWEAQWQEFLETVQSPTVVWQSPEIADITPWDDAKAFLASFEQVAKACQWPWGEWVARLQPALSGEAKQAFGNLEARDREDYEKVKAAILREDAIQMEAQRQHFRQFHYEEMDEPWRIHSQLRELCCRWLRPERRSKEQILELLILEQFLASLPPDLQGWIRAGGPDTCSQAVALVEDFLMSQQEARREKWQEPMPEMTRISPDAEKASADDLQKQIQKEAKMHETSSRDNSFMDSQSSGPKDPNLLLPPPDEPETNEDDVTEVPVHFREAEVACHMVESTPAHPEQQTMFWQVMQEEDAEAESLEGLLVPKPELASHPEEEEQVFVQFPVASERLQSQDSGEEKRSWVKMETSHEEKTEALTGLSQWIVPATLGKAQEQRCESRGDEGKKPVVGVKESRVIFDGFTAARSKSSLLHSRAEKLLSSKYGRRDHYRPGLNMPFAKKEHMECLMWWGNLQPKTKAREEKAFECSRCGKYFSQRHNLRRHQRIHTGEKPHVCPDCGRSFARPDGLVSHQRKHFHVKPFECLECGKNFTYKCNLAKHQRIHVREVVL